MQTLLSKLSQELVTDPRNIFALSKTSNICMIFLRCFVVLYYLVASLTHRPVSRHISHQLKK